MFRRLASAFGLLYLALLGALGLALMVSVEAPAVRGRVLTLVALAAALGLLVMLALSAFLARQIGRRLRDVTQAAERLGNGPGVPRVFPDGYDELGKLGRTFNRMSERLAEHIALLEQDRQQLRTVLSGMVEGVVALDADQRILFVNDRAAQLLDFPPLPCGGPPIGRRLWEVVRQRPLLDVVRRALAHPEPQREELGWNGAATRSLTVHAARLPGVGPQHAVRGAVLVLHDTTELRRLERLRQDFVANVSHELKTPLAVIKACVDTLLDGAVEDAQHRGRFLQQIAKQGDRLHALILDLLSLARIESGAEVFNFQAVHLAAVVSTCAERHRPRAEAQGQTLAIRAEAPDGRGMDEEPQDLAVWADEEALDHILDNLLDNALKYTPEGGQVCVRWAPAGSLVCLEISDTGVGIPEADLPRIFERFYRADKARSRELGGTGLGLSIVKHLTQAMHGSVRVASRLGQGSTFTICLPRAAPPHALPR